MLELMLRALHEVVVQVKGERYMALDRRRVRARDIPVQALVQMLHHNSQISGEAVGGAKCDMRQDSHDAAFA